jgi:hypothetical protein
MMKALVRHVVSAFAVLAVSFVALSAAADEPSKKMCIDSHSKAQDAKEDGELSLARKLFMACAQPQCPALVQSDCARFADELERSLPSLSFAARDDKGNDLPDTTVYVDEKLVVTSLADGRPHEVDPGTHKVRFVNGERESVSTIVVGSGEKARAVLATFKSPDTGGGAQANGEAVEMSEKPRSRGARAMMIAGAGVMVAGGALAVIGLKQVPSNCKVSSHECAAPPGDRSFDEAEKAIRLNNMGWIATGVGAAALAAGIVWHIKSGKDDEEETKDVAPFVTAGGGGVTFTTRM